MFAYVLFFGFGLSFTLFIMSLMRKGERKLEATEPFHSLPVGSHVFRFYKDGKFEMVEPPSDKLPFNQVTRLARIPYGFINCYVHSAKLVHKNRLEYIVTPYNANKNVRVSLWFYVNPTDKKMFNTWNVGKPYLAQDQGKVLAEPTPSADAVTKEYVDKTSVMLYSSPGKKKASQTLQEVEDAAHGSKE